MSKTRSNLTFIISLADTVSVFSRVSKDTNLQFRSIRDKTYTATHPHSMVSGSKRVISISIHLTNGSDLIRGVDGDGAHLETNIHT